MVAWRKSWGSKNTYPDSKITSKQKQKYSLNNDNQHWISRIVKIIQQHQKCKNFAIPL